MSVRPAKTQNLRCPHEETLGPSLRTERTAKTLINWANAQADLSLRWAHTHFVGFVMSRLISQANDCRGHTPTVEIITALNQCTERHFLFTSQVLYIEQAQHA